MARGGLGRVAEVVRTILSREELDELPVPAGGRQRPSLVGLLVAREELPLDSPVASGKEGLLSWLLKPEPLPLDDPAPPSGRTSFLARLFAPERLAEDEAPAGRPVGRGGADSRGGAGR